MAVALIVAAGSGERLGADRPKAFVTLAGKPMIEWSVQALRAVPAIERIAVALPAGERAPTGTIGVPGSDVRSGSVRAALAAAGDGDPVVVHDAARPLVGTDVVERALAGVAGVDGVAAATPVTDTVKLASEDGLVRTTLDRTSLWAVQTPQVFVREVLERALAVDPDVLAAATDDAWLVERLGGTVRLVSSPAENIKVTTPTDLRVAERLLGRRDTEATGA